MRNLFWNPRSLGGQACALLLCGLATTASAEVTLPNIFSDAMVLQRNQDNPVWRRAAAGEAVTVTLGEQTHQTTADEQGEWSVTLDPIPANAQPQTLTVAGDNQLSVENILVGEVWVCSG